MNNFKLQKEESQADEHSQGKVKKGQQFQNVSDRNLGEKVELLKCGPKS